MSSESDLDGILPAPDKVREQLGRNLRQAKILRSLLRLSRQAVAEVSSLSNDEDKKGDAK